MATSISKAQAKALADGFLDGIGGSRDELKPKETLSEIIVLAGELVTQVQKNLIAADRIATGALSESFKVLNPELSGRDIRVDVEALHYYQFIDAGVRGTKSGTSAKGYSYKNKMPPVNTIRKWLIREGLKARTNVGGRPITGREARRKSISETSNTIAFIIARSIKQKGLKRTNFFTKAVRKIRSKAKGQLAKGFKIDIINAIPKKL